MVDRITKRLRKMPGKEQRVIKRMMKRIQRGDVEGLDIKKLRGGSHMYRARKGSVRIIYSVTGKKYELVDVNRRSDTTYKKY